MATPGHLSYKASVGYKKNFDRDVHADTGIFNRLKVHDLVTNDTTIVDNMCFPNGTAAAPSITFCNDLATGLYRTAAGNVGVADSGIPLAAFDSATPHGLIVGDATVNMAHLSSIQVASPSLILDGIAITGASVFVGSTDSAGSIQFTSANGVNGTIFLQYATAYSAIPSVIVFSGDNIDAMGAPQGTSTAATMVQANGMFVTSAVGGFTINLPVTSATPMGDFGVFHYKVMAFI